jgi:acetyl-CoA synthetase
VGTGDRVSQSADFIACRDRLLQLRGDWAQACREFRWPRFTHFNWANDYFDVIARDNAGTALRVVDDAGADQSLSFAELARRSQQVAAFFATHGLKRGDRLLVMLPNAVPLWETLLAAIRMGVVVIPATTLLQRADLADRIERGRVDGIVTEGALAGRFEGLPRVALHVTTGSAASGWIDYAEAYRSPASYPVIATRADELLFLYFTSGTTARPKLVAHSHVSYPIGHLTTLYALGLKPGDVHLNLSSPGWAKHAWSCLFAPWNAEATVLAYQYERFDPRALLTQLARCHVTTFCAPPTVWRMLIEQNLKAWPVRLREATSAGEPLNPEVMARVQDAWGITVRDVYGQTETSAQIGNPPGQPVKAGSMGRALPGCPIVLLNVDGKEAAEGEICIDRARQPLGLMTGYCAEGMRDVEPVSQGYYHTGDVAARDADGYLTYVGRMDDVFKSSDYRISPFELESVLIEHAEVTEAAVVPSPDPVRLSVPKAFIALRAGSAPDAATAASILAHVRARVSPYKRIRRLEFAPLPKTISGKIRRVELRALELARPAQPARRPQEFWEEDLSG